MAGDGRGNLVPRDASEISGTRCHSADWTRNRPSGFRALNIFETIFAVTLLLAICLDMPTMPIGITVSFALLALALQLVVIRPRLTARSNAILDGLDAPRSRAHYAYIGLEAVKVVALMLAGVLLLAAATGG